MIHMKLDGLSSELLQYLVHEEIKPGDRLPALTELSPQLGVSVGKLREQLEVARELGLVSVRPRLGTRRAEYDFHPAVLTSLLFAMATNEASFEQFSHLRQVLETSMWHGAVSQLTAADLDELHLLVERAWAKLRGQPVHIPSGEHRQLHLKIFSRLDNPFVLGILRAYWDAYEASELTRFADYQYWLDVWHYHEEIVKAIDAGDLERGRQILIEHFALLPTVTVPPGHRENGRITLSTMETP
jgi:DNA-binding FadR family transcriptional regulator